MIFIMFLCSACATSCADQDHLMVRYVSQASDEFASIASGVLPVTPWFEDDRTLQNQKLAFYRDKDGGGRSRSRTGLRAHTALLTGNNREFFEYFSLKQASYGLRRLAPRNSTVVPGGYTITG